MDMKETVETSNLDLKIDNLLKTKEAYNMAYLVSELLIKDLEQSDEYDDLEKAGKRWLGESMEIVYQLEVVKSVKAVLVSDTLVEEINQINEMIKMQVLNEQLGFSMICSSLNHFINELNSVMLAKGISVDKTVKLGDRNDVYLLKLKTELNLSLAKGKIVNSSIVQTPLSMLKERMEKY